MIMVVKNNAEKDYWAYLQADHNQRNVFLNITLSDHWN